MYSHTLNADHGFGPVLSQSASFPSALDVLFSSPCSRFSFDRHTTLQPSATFSALDQEIKRLPSNSSIRRTLIDRSICSLELERSSDGLVPQLQIRQSPAIQPASPSMQQMIPSPSLPRPECRRCQSFSITNWFTGTPLSGPQETFILIGEHS